MNMTVREVKEKLENLRESSVPGEKIDGSRIHIKYERKPDSKNTKQAQKEAERAEILGLPKDTYTGRVNQIWYGKNGDLLLNMYVELERDHKFRTFNVDKGTINHIVVLEE